MLNGIVNNIKHDRAIFAHEIAYLRDIHDDDVLSERMEKADPKYRRESVSDLIDAKAMIEEMTVESAQEDFDNEIDRLMESTEDMTFEEMLGISEDDSND